MSGDPNVQSIAYVLAEFEYNCHYRGRLRLIGKPGDLFTVEGDLAPRFAAEFGNRPTSPSQPFRLLSAAAYHELVAVRDAARREAEAARARREAEEREAAEQAERDAAVVAAMREIVAARARDV